MLNNLFIFIFALFLVFKGSTMATKYANNLARSFHLSKYVVGFIIVAVISIIPETFIAVSSSFAGIPSFGLGVLFGSNIADLTLIFAILVFYASRSLKVESKILKNQVVYPFLLLLPIILGLDGFFSRVEGITLIIAGMVFYYTAIRNETDGSPIPVDQKTSRKKSIILLLASMAILLIGAHFTVVSASSLAHAIGVSPVLIGMLVVGLGTTMPELFFSLQSIKKQDDSLAIGDLLGTVLADATIVVGILATINPFAFPQKIIFVTGTFMVFASLVLFMFMRSGQSINKREAFHLLGFWILFVVVEYFFNR